MGKEENGTMMIQETPSGQAKRDKEIPGANESAEAQREREEK